MHSQTPTVCTSSPYGSSDFLLPGKALSRGPEAGMCWARVRVASMEGVTCAWACCQPQVPSQSLVLGWFHSGTGQALRAGLPHPAGSSPLSSAHRAQPSPGRPRGSSLSSCEAATPSGCPRPAPVGWGSPQCSSQAGPGQPGHGQWWGQWLRTAEGRRGLRAPAGARGGWRVVGVGLVRHPAC